MKVVKLSALRTDRLYSPVNIPGSHSSKMAESTQRPYCGRKVYVNEKFQ